MPKLIRAGTFQIYCPVGKPGFFERERGLTRECS
jgi:hypothetical protein